MITVICPVCNKPKEAIKGRLAGGGGRMHKECYLKKMKEDRDFVKKISGIMFDSNRIGEKWGN